MFLSRLRKFLRLYLPGLWLPPPFVYELVLSEPEKIFIETKNRIQVEIVKVNQKLTLIDTYGVDRSASA